MRNRSCETWSSASSQTLSANHLNTGIARVKLGRALLRQQRYREAEEQLFLANDILQKQAGPSSSWLKSAREDLVAVYVALGQPDRAEQFRRENARH